MNKSFVKINDFINCLGINLFNLIIILLFTGVSFLLQIKLIYLAIVFNFILFAISVCDYIPYADQLYIASIASCLLCYAVLHKIGIEHEIELLRFNPFCVFIIILPFLGYSLLLWLKNDISKQ